MHVILQVPLSRLLHFCVKFQTDFLFVTRQLFLQAVPLRLYVNEQAILNVDSIYAKLEFPLYY